MMLARLQLTNVRNYAELDFAPPPGLSVLTGANAQGKSNLLEAIGLLGIGRSFRAARESDLVRHGLPGASARGDVRARAGLMRLECRIERSEPRTPGTAPGRSGARKRFTLNGAPVRYAGYLGRLRIVTFVPADLQLVSGPPSLRRALLSAALAQESPAYYAALASYARAQTQKSALLRAGAPDLDLLAIYDERLVEAGTRLMLARRAYVAALAERAEATYRSWVGDGDGALAVRYAPSVPLETSTEDAVAAAFAARLRLLRPAEIARRMLLGGPHRDDLAIDLGGRPLASFGSQGQQRTAVLALKVAEYAVMHARGGEAPLLLLDDVLSELDAARRRAFLGGVESFEQAFVTTTAEPGASGEMRLGTTFRIRAGTLAPA